MCLKILSTTSRTRNVDPRVQYQVSELTEGESVLGWEYRLRSGVKRGGRCKWEKPQQEVTAGTPWRHYRFGSRPQEGKCRSKASHKFFGFLVHMKATKARLQAINLAWQMAQESVCQCRRCGLIPGSGRCPRGGHGNPLQYSCLENPHGQRSLAGYSPWGRKESDMTEWACTYTVY